MSTRDSARAVATVTWEDAGYAEREIFFETDSRFRDDLAADPNAFLLAVYVPAWRYGERRIRVDGRVCPRLRDGLVVVAQQLSNWYDETGHAPRIEAGDGFSPSVPATPPRAAVCMSGGVDSLASLRRNLLDFPAEHPGAVKDLLFINGFDVGGHHEWDTNSRAYEQARSRFERFAETLQRELLPIRTNIRHLEEDAPGAYYTDLFVLQSFAACLAATVHAFAPRVTALHIPSSHSVSDLEPLGSHPLLDSNYSSSAVEIRHDGLGLSRLEKTELLSDWPEGLRILRVCADPSRHFETTNCGRCEKCLRTMISLLVLGRLHECETFEADDLAPDDIARLWCVSPGEGASPFGYLSYGCHHFWEQMLAPLESMGRHDLARAVASKLAESRTLARRGRYWRFIRRTLAKVSGGLADGRR